MIFCKSCDNMLYIRLSKEHSIQLIYYCRNCGNTYEDIDKDNLCILTTETNTTENAYLQDINEFTKLDPTLPRTHNIKCPNQLCISNEKVNQGDPSKNEVIYIRYDDTNLKYAYICTMCDTVWHTTDPY